MNDTEEMMRVTNEEAFEYMAACLLVAMDGIKRIETTKRELEKELELWKYGDGEYPQKKVQDKNFVIDNLMNVSRMAARLAEKMR